MTEPRILFWDIESTQLDADFGFMLAYGYKAQGDKKPTVVSVLEQPTKDGEPDTNLLRHAYTTLCSADMWVTFYGKEFDVKFLKSRMLNLGLTLPPIHHVDLYFIAKQNMKLHSHRLASISAFLGVEEKTPLVGRTWVLASRGNKNAIKEVIEHCRQDVVVLEQAYDKLRPYIRTHPHVFNIGACQSCGSTRLQARGTQPKLLQSGRLTKRYTKVRRIQCMDCGRWDTREI